MKTFHTVLLPWPKKGESNIKKIDLSNHCVQHASNTTGATTAHAKNAMMKTKISGQACKMLPTYLQIIVFILQFFYLLL